MRCHMSASQLQRNDDSHDDIHFILHSDDELCNRFQTSHNIKLNVHLRKVEPMVCVLEPLLEFARWSGSGRSRDRHCARDTCQEKV